MAKNCRHTRRKVLELFSSTEGINYIRNIEEITHFINARGMKSEIATLQALGRALRRHPSKDKVFIYDFLDKEKYLKGHSNARKRHYEKEGHEVLKL